MKMVAKMPAPTGQLLKPLKNKEKTQAIILKRKFPQILFLSLVVIALLAILPDQLAAKESQTVYSGDVLQGKKVISVLEASELSTGLHQHYFQVSLGNQGVPAHVPVIVLKGEKPGPRLLLTAGVHGDELNGIAVIHSLLKKISYRQLSGTIIAVPGLNPSGLAANSRYFVGTTGALARKDLNRLFPGRLTGGGAAERFIGTLWHNLLIRNADFAVDLHTQTTGLEYPLFVFADFNNPAAKRMAYALMPEMIKNDSGEKGTLETTLVSKSVPAVTFEIGAPKLFQPEMIEKAVDGILNLMRMRNMLGGKVVTAAEPPYLGTKFSNIYAETSGASHLKVTLGQEVNKGDLLAISFDAFGNEQKRYFAPEAGRIVSIATDPMREVGALLVRILY